MKTVSRISGLESPPVVTGTIGGRSSSDPLITRTTVYPSSASPSSTVHTNTTIARLVKGVHDDSSLVGNSISLCEARELIDRFSSNDFPVLISGETGTGKELVARDLHRKSERANNKFLAINCAALPDEIAESIFFGHEKGSFTDADGRALGGFELASGGTLFLDEVGELSPTVQCKLLKVLDSGLITRVGGEKDIQVDVRIIAATNRDLRQLVLNNGFSEQLFYRLNVCEIEMPPLREHPEDIERISLRLLEKNMAIASQKELLGFTSLAIEKLQSHNWPGNVRELENVIKRGIITASDPLFITENEIAISNNELDQLVIKHFMDFVKSPLPILISGEVGSGKGHIADGIHINSGRTGAFVNVNCAGITPSLIDSHLFGHIKGSFTGARNAHKGYFHQAEGGTLFLDGIDKLPIETQTKLLRALQENEIYRVGSKTPEKINVRILASSNENLNEAVKKHRFREDLLNRINVVPLEIKPLRERKEEIPVLVKEFITKHRGKKNITDISNKAMEVLLNYGWEGNIRELESTIKRAISMANGEIITKDDIKLKPLRINPLSNFPAKRRKEISDSLILSILKEEVLGSATIKEHRKEFGNFSRICYHLSDLILEKGNSPTVEKNDLIDRLGMNGSVMYKILRNCGYREYDEFRSYIHQSLQQFVQSGKIPVDGSLSEEENKLNTILLNDFYKLLSTEYDPLTFLNLACLKQYTLKELLSGNDPSENEVATKIGVNSGTLHNIRSEVFKCTWKEFKPKLLAEYNSISI